MDKPTTTLHTGQFSTALLWVMGQLGQAHKQDIFDEFERQFGHLIPPPQRETSATNGNAYWRTNLDWRSSELTKIGLLFKQPANTGLWAITKAGRTFVNQPISFDAAYEKLRQLISSSKLQDSFLPQSLGDSLLPYVRLITHLHETYTATEIVSLLGQVHPPIVTDVQQRPGADELVADLCNLRLLEFMGGGRYRRWQYLSDGNEESLLRYIALTLLVPTGDTYGGYTLPAMVAPFDGQPHPTAEWPLGEPLVRWYEEAGLVKRIGDTMWQSLPDALEPRDGTTETILATNTFLHHLVQVRANEENLLASGDETLPILDPTTLAKRIAEIQTHLLIDDSTIMRIYRALISGHHVILSGPPGTGKTHLARLLPHMLWRDTEETTILTMPTNPLASPTDPPIQQSRRRQGYMADVVTATEDWSVRHVIGGIAPRLERTSQGNSLVYSVRHGCMTRAVLANYANYDGANIPALDTLRRQEVHDGEHTYRGHWLVIDEFTRAPIDAAFGSLLTTLGGQHSPLMVPTDDGDVAVPMPKDFRIIGTLNSFDRHFLNQMSEAMKRRFVFIDVLPPSRDAAEAEQGMALYHALVRLYTQGVPGITVDEDAGVAEWKDMLVVQRRLPSGSANDEGITRNTSPHKVVYNLTYQHEGVAGICETFWSIFSAIRVYRQLGTAQAEAIYTAVVSAAIIGMYYDDALDAALADTLADQLQVLARDEQRVLLAYIVHNNSDAFTNEVRAILQQLPLPRQIAHLALLHAADPASDTTPIDTNQPASLTSEQLSRIFVRLSVKLQNTGLFASRLQAFIAERGL